MGDGINAKNTIGNPSIPRAAGTVRTTAPHWGASAYRSLSISIIPSVIQTLRITDVIPRKSVLGRGVTGCPRPQKHLKILILIF